MQQSQSQHIGDKSCQFFPQSLVWPNISGIPNIPGIHPYFGQQNMLQGGTFPFQTSITSQKFGMHPFLSHYNVSQVCIFLVRYFKIFSEIYVANLSVFIIIYIILHFIL